MSTASLGSISHGTMRPVDLLEAFSSELRTLDTECLHAALLAEVSEVLDMLEGEDEQAEQAEQDASELVCSLEDALQEYAPPYAYFGSHPGDGADYGFWLSEDFQLEAEDSGALIVSDTSEVPEDYTGEVLHVNERGNATLYSAEDGELSEVWSIV